MFRAGLVIALAGLVACTSSANPSATDGTTEPEAYPSDFTTGKHRATRLALEAQDEGADFDGDGVGDNNLPFVLETADAILSDQDLAPESFDAQIASSIEEGSLNVLFDSRYGTGVLTIAALNGLADEETGALSIDPTSLDGGEPITVFEGEFSSQTAFSVGAERAVLIIPFTPDQPPSAVPLERVTLSGTVDSTTMNATLTGLMPAEEFADDVLADLIPEEGVGNLSKETLLKTVRRLAGLDTMADIDMGDGRRAVSCAFQVQGATATWTE